MTNVPDISVFGIADLGQLGDYRLVEKLARAGWAWSTRRSTPNWIAS